MGSSQGLFTKVHRQDITVRTLPAGYTRSLGADLPQLQSGISAIGLALRATKGPGPWPIRLKQRRTYSSNFDHGCVDWCLLTTLHEVNPDVGPGLEPHPARLKFIPNPPPSSGPASCLQSSLRVSEILFLSLCAQLSA
jgi:hypothetical protein